MKNMSGMRRCNKVSVFMQLFLISFISFFAGLALLLYLLATVPEEETTVLLVFMSFGLLIGGLISVVTVVQARSRYWSARLGKPQTLRVIAVRPDPEVVVKGEQYYRLICRSRDGVEFLSGTLPANKAKPYYRKDVLAYINHRTNAYCIQVPGVYSY